MRQFLKRWFFVSCAVAIAAQMISGIKYDGMSDLIIASFLLGILNAVVRPIMVILSLPIVVMTLGLFVLVINALLLYLVGHLMKGFHVDSFWAAFWGALIISCVSVILNALTKSGQPQDRRRPDPPRPPPPSRDDGQGPIIDV